MCQGYHIITSSPFWDMHARDMWNCLQMHGNNRTNSNSNANFEGTYFKIH